MTRRRLTKSEFEAVQRRRPADQERRERAVWRDDHNAKMLLVREVLKEFPQMSRSDALRAVEDRWRFDEAPVNMAIASELGLVIIADDRAE